MINSLLDVESLWTYDYWFDKLIGQGHVGTVYRAVDVCGEATKGRTSKDVVVKMYSGDHNVDAFKKEVELLERVKGHPNVVSILASYGVAKKGIIMPFYGESDLFDYVWQNDGLSEIKAAGFTRDLLSALQYIHSCGIIHRDVKPENVVVGQEGRAVLLDVDVACYASDTLATMMQCGSPGYVAPEVLQGKPCSFLSDVFSVGCVVYFMIAKLHPFLKKKEASPKDIQDANEECKLTFGRRLKNASRESRHFIASIVVRNPQGRLSRPQASAHPWLSREETAAPQRKVATSADGAALSHVPAMHFEKIHSLPAGHGTCRKPGTAFLLPQPSSVCRDLAGKVSHAISNLRGKSSTVSPLGSTCDDSAEDFAALTGVLIRD